MAEERHVSLLASSLIHLHDTEVEQFEWSSWPKVIGIFGLRHRSRFRVKWPSSDLASNDCLVVLHISPDYVGPQNHVWLGTLHGNSHGQSCRCEAGAPSRDEDMMSSQDDFYASSQLSQISPSRSRRRRSKFTYKHLSLLSQYSSNCPLRVIAHIDLDAFYAQCEGVRLGIADDQPLAVQVRSNPTSAYDSLEYSCSPAMAGIDCDQLPGSQVWSQ